MSTTGVTIVSHTVTAAEAGLTLITADNFIFDNNGSAGGTSTVTCFTEINGGGSGLVMTVSDNGNAFSGDTTSSTTVERQTLNAGDVVSIFCQADPADNNEAGTNDTLELEHVTS